ncbi:MAG TPA: multiheme c-type cytochrome [Thermoanaerobaculia bacterium]|nr:multiheme c-type cytochrome [Thermoanaerobaculia bacterium]
MRRFAFVVILAAAAARAQQPDAPGRYVGVASCVNAGCHGATVPLNAQRVRQNEYYTWLHSDRHAQAYNVLFNNLSKRIAKNMRLKAVPYQEKVCLDCHSTNVPKELVSGRIDPEDGVQCEACHGPAGGWRAEHVQEGWTHAQSVARGMFDERDLRVRAHGCDRCHVGSADREVDHELIASGHPLLAFELDNYTETMPAHWNPNETHGVRAWATGQAMALRDSLNNLARHARGEKWPEFSDMSCTNCHHALRGTARQERGWPGRAGLPAWSPQRWAVTRVIVAKVSPSSRSALDDAIATVAARVSRMNDPAGVASAAEEARRLVEAALPRIDSATWSDGEIRAMIAAIADDRDVLARADVQSAEQTALALQSLASALTRRTPSLARGPLMKSIDALFEELKAREDYDAGRFAEKLAAVRRAV